jgi:hypothetical protein
MLGGYEVIRDVEQQRTRPRRTCRDVENKVHMFSSPKDEFRLPV